jgi:hypothetical protein
MKSGVTITRQDDFDGTKAALDRSRSRRARLVPVAKAERDVPFPHAYDRIERRTRELHAQGYCLKDATAMAIAEDPDADEKEAQADAEQRAAAAGNHVTASMLQREGFKPRGGGGGGGHRRKKKGTRVCSNCHLEGCQCGGIAKSSGPGAPRKDNPKSEHVSARITPKVRKVLKSAGITPARAMELTAIALEQGRLYADVAKQSAA